MLRSPALKSLTTAVAALLAIAISSSAAAPPAKHEVPQLNAREAFAAKRAFKDAAGVACKPKPHPAAVRVPLEYFPKTLTGLWPVELASRRCVYMINARSSHLHAFGGDPSPWRLDYPWVAWSPHGTEIVIPEISNVAYQHEVDILNQPGYRSTISDLGRRILLLNDRSGEATLLQGRPLGFFSNGTLVTTLHGALWNERKGPARLLATKSAITRTAGFDGLVEETSLVSFGTYGDGAVAFGVHHDLPDFKERELVVLPDGRLLTASPTYTRPGEVNAALGPAFWSPDGLVLFELNIIPPKTGGHRHCLDTWSRSDGYRVLFCGIHRIGTAAHFDRLMWAPDGKTALLSNGWTITRHGQLLPTIDRGPNTSFAISWSNTATG